MARYEALGNVIESVVRKACEGKVGVVFRSISEGGLNCLGMILDRYKYTRAATNSVDDVLFG